MDMSVLAINKIIVDVKEAKSSSDLQECLDSLRKCIGFDWYMFAMNRSEGMPDHLFLTNYPSDWLMRYGSEKLFNVDPVVKYVLNHQDVVFWDTFKDLEGYNTKKQIEFMRLAQSYGLGSGCSIPCNSYGRFAVFSIAVRSEKEMENIYEYLPHIHYFANQIKNSVLSIDDIIGVNLDHEKVTLREKDCLYWGSEGKTSWEISQILGISERTVVFHFNNAAKKLNAANRQHAISKALIYGVIKPKF